ncbi:MAG TPA: YciI family protein [Streptosporangiaceae bacterium]|nr:YciI family protein [Streptosporangiaceae bacterium]
MRYAMLICTDENVVTSPEEQKSRAAGFAAFEEAMKARGLLVASEEMQPTSTAATVRCWPGGDVMVARGPVADLKEQITGVCVIECGNMDEAIDVATRIPAAWYGTIEVRPVRQP